MQACSVHIDDAGMMLHEGSDRSPAGKHCLAQQDRSGRQSTAFPSGAGPNPCLLESCIIYQCHGSPVSGLRLHPHLDSGVQYIALKDPVRCLKIGRPLPVALASEESKAVACSACNALIPKLVNLKRVPTTLVVVDMSDPLL